MRQADRRRGRGRPPLPQPTLTEPKTTLWGPGQREECVAVLANMILTHYYQQWRAERGLPRPAKRRAIYRQRKMQVRALRHDPSVRMP